MVVYFTILGLQMGSGVFSVDWRGCHAKSDQLYLLQGLSERLLVSSCMGRCKPSSYPLYCIQCYFRL